MSRRHRTYTRFILVLLWFAALFTWMLSLSQVSADWGLQVYGARDHVAGQHSVIRVVGVDTKVRYPTSIINPAHRWSNDKTQTAWQPLEFTKRTAWQAGITAPQSPGIWTLEVRSTIRGNLVQAATKLSIAAKQNAPDVPKFESIPKIEWSVGQATSAVHIAPLDGTIKRGFSNKFVLIASPNGPTPTLSFVNARHLDQSVVLEPTDVEDVYTFDITPEVGELVFKVTDLSVVGTVQFSTDLAYYRIHAEPIQTGEIKLSVESRDRDENISVDLWQSPYWLQTRRLAGGQTVNTAQFSTSSTASHLLWVQAYTNPLNPLQARGGRFILTDSTQERVRTAWKGTTDAERFSPLRHSTLFNRFVLGQLKKPESKPVLIADSSIHQAPELMERRQRWMQIVAGLLALSTLCLIAFVLFRIHRHRKDLRIRFLDLDVEDELSEDQQKLESSIKEGVVMILFIGVLVTGVTWLFLNARW